MKVKKHNEGTCDCSQEPQALFQTYTPSEVHLWDWLCFLFGALTPCIMRPICRRHLGFRYYGPKNKYREQLPRPISFASLESDEPSDMFTFLEAFEFTPQRDPIAESLQALINGQTTKSQGASGGEFEFCLCRLCRPVGETQPAKGLNRDKSDNLAYNTSALNKGRKTFWVEFNSGQLKEHPRSTSLNSVLSIQNAMMPCYTISKRDPFPQSQVFRVQVMMINGAALSTSLCPLSMCD
jgi:hypothetical protein